MNAARLNCPHARCNGENPALYRIVEVFFERGFDAALEVDRRRIEVAEPIKRLGEHRVHVRLHRDVVAELTVDVQPAGAAPA